MESNRTFTIAEVAKLTGTHPDTIRRRIKDGSLPNARPRPGDRTGIKEIPESDLIAAGLLEPAGPTRLDPHEQLARRQAEREYSAMREEVLQLRTGAGKDREVIELLQKVLREEQRTNERLTQAIAELAGSLHGRAA